MKASRLSLLVAAASVSLLALSGCSSQPEPVSVAGTEWGDAAKTDTPSIAFAEDGKITGTDGCNRLMGSYTETAGEVVFSPLASTMMFCEGVETWLGGATKATVDGDTITFVNEEGAKIGDLKRAK